MIDAEAEGVELWKEELSEASGPVVRRQGALEGNGLVALLASLALLLASAIVLFPKFKHLTQGEWTVGMVIGHQSYGYGSGSMRAPIIRYSAPGGVFRKLADIPAARGTYPIDKEVWILYLRGEPGNAVVYDFIQLAMIPTVVGGLGLFCPFVHGHDYDLASSPRTFYEEVRRESSPVRRRTDTGDQGDTKDAKRPITIPRMPTPRMTPRTPTATTISRTPMARIIARMPSRAIKRFGVGPMEAEKKGSEKGKSPIVCSTVDLPIYGEQKRSTVTKARPMDRVVKSANRRFSLDIQPFDAELP